MSNSEKNFNKLAEKIFTKFRFIAESEIGKGAFGRVIEGKFRSIKNNVAIKLIYLEKGKYSPEYFRKQTLNIETEIIFSFGLNHKNLIKTLKYGIEENEKGRLYGLIMEKSLHKNLDKFSRTLHGNINDSIYFKSEKLGMKYDPLMENINRFLFSQILNSVGFLHTSNIIHFDLKPENILITNGFLVKICDFGISKEIVKSEELIELKDGTLGYMGQEYFTESQKIKKEDADKVDIFALGSILFYMTFNEHFLNREFKDKYDIDYIVKTRHQFIMESNIDRKLKNLIIRLTSKIDERPRINELISDSWVNENRDIIKKISVHNEGEQIKKILEIKHKVNVGHINKTIVENKRNKKFTIKI